MDIVINNRNRPLINIFLVDLKSINKAGAKNLFRKQDNKQNNGDISLKMRYRILLVEDDYLIQKIHLHYLQEMGFYVDIANNGHEALAFFDNTHDVILLDLGLPDIDGLTVCSTIRYRFPNSSLPIIAVTSQGKLVGKQCFDAGINEVITKPVQPESLQQTILFWLAKAVEAEIDF